ncbi:unnamed protein product [Onchocerca ochengi]|uniref:PAS domain-containing protein n=1 Tax=Onchocerca ochengi TaxID=42157 RepID=A0A182EP95_ONCOC|nr:unnamed protein product [Onchocerca ochengi]
MVIDQMQKSMIKLEFRNLLRICIDSAGCGRFRLLTTDKKTDAKVASNENKDEDDEENCEMKVKMETKTDDASRVTTEKLLVSTEPATVLSVACTLDAKGRIFRADDGMAILLGYVSMSELLGIEILKLIPAVQLETNIEVQYVCALSIRGSSIPVTVKVNTERDPETQRPLLYELRIRAVSSVSGVVILTKSGALLNFNEHFIEALIGKRKKEALKDIAHITDIIPKFHSHMLTSPLDETNNEVAMKMFELFEHSTNKGCSTAAPSQNNHSSITWQINDLAVSLQKMEPLENVRISSSHSSVSEIYSSAPSTSSQCSNVQSWNQMIVDEERTNNQTTSIMEGSFHGFAKHSDGNLIG